MYGFIGAGELTAAIVTGLSTVADPPSVVLSPRGRDVARGLAARFPNVRVCVSNQEVLDTATTVVLAVRPRIAGDVLPSLAFRESHVVLSALAGVRLSRLRSWVSPARDIVRAIPRRGSCSTGSATSSCLPKSRRWKPSARRRPRSPRTSTTWRPSRRG